MVQDLLHLWRRLPDRLYPRRPAERGKHLRKQLFRKLFFRQFFLWQFFLRGRSGAKLRFSLRRYPGHSGERHQGLYHQTGHRRRRPAVDQNRVYPERTGAGGVCSLLPAEIESIMKHYPPLTRAYVPCHWRVFSIKAVACGRSLPSRPPQAPESPITAEKQKDCPASSRTISSKQILYSQILYSLPRTAPTPGTASSSSLRPSRGSPGS